MANAKKFIKDAVFTSKAEAMAHLNDGMNMLRSAGYDDDLIWSMIQDNIEGTPDPETGELLANFGPDENGAPAFDPSAEVGNVAIIVPANAWDMTNTIPQAEGMPWATPKAIYVLSLPKVADALADSKLKTLIADLITKAELSAARNVAKKHFTDPAGAPLTRDPVMTMVAGAARGTGNPNKAAIKAMMPFAADVLLAVVSKKVEALKAAKQFTQARALAGTFSRARLNAQTMEECLSSAAAAEFHFGSMAQAQWETLLQYIIEQCPKHTIRKLVKDEDGKTVKDPATGKAVYSDPIPAPVSPVVFQSWLETRNETDLEADETVAIDLSSLMGGVGAEPQAAANPQPVA